MNYEELQKEIASIVLQREALNAAMKTRLAEIVEFAEFKKGDRVRFTYWGKQIEAIIVRADYYEGKGKFIYTANRVKVDGTEGKHDESRIKYAEKIEKI